MARSTRTHEGNGGYRANLTLSLSRDARIAKDLALRSLKFFGECLGAANPSQGTRGPSWQFIDGIPTSYAQFPGELVWVIRDSLNIRPDKWRGVYRLLRRSTGYFRTYRAPPRVM